MIIIPEIETVVILVPRAGSTAIKNAVMRTHKGAILLYRHMEADGVPHGYDRWRRVGVVRHPTQRLWSLYKYLRDMKQEPNWSPGFADRMRATVQMPFDRWVTDNTTVFTEPYTRGGIVPGFWPKYSILHSLPETRKSQFLYLRPDLGTQVFRFDDLGALADDLQISLRAENHTIPETMPGLSDEARQHIASCFAWDLEASA